jgi:subfamily B ATP-binding cassette protein MsbA
VNGANADMVRTLLAYLRRWRGLLTLTVLTAALLTGLELVWIGLVVPLITTLTGHLDQGALPEIVRRVEALWSGVEGEARLWALLGTIVVVALARGMAGLAYAWMVATIHSRTNLAVKEDLSAKIFGLGLLDFQRHRVSDLAVYLGPQSHNVGQMLQTVFTSLPQVFGVISALAVCFLLSVRLTLLAIVLFAVVAAAFRPLLRIQQDVARREKDHFKQVLFLASETLLGFKSIALASRQAWFGRRLEGELNALADTQRMRSTLAGAVPWLTQTLALLGMAVLLAATLRMLGSTRETLVLFTLFFVIVTRTVGYLQNLMGVRAGVSTSLPATREICAFLTAEPLLPGPTDGPRHEAAFEDRIAFAGVRFRYPRGFALRDVSFEIAAGERVGIVGASGSGKSTLVDLLLKVLEPDEGRITLDGVDQREFATDAWRSVFGVVPQEAYLMNGTLEENVRFGNEALSEAELREAMRSAMIDDLVAELPEGLRTVVGDRGTTLSGGQRQRVAIARALANRRQILVFDEATSALDALSEREVQRAIDQLSGRLTLVIVTHRLASLRDCDKVIVVGDGRVLEAGSIAELLERRGPFHRLSVEQGVSERLFSEEARP